ITTCFNRFQSARPRELAADDRIVLIAVQEIVEAIDVTVENGEPLLLDGRERFGVGKAPQPRAIWYWFSVAHLYLRKASALQKKAQRFGVNWPNVAHVHQIVGRKGVQTCGIDRLNHQTRIWLELPIGQADQLD